MQLKIKIPHTTTGDAFWAHVMQEVTQTSQGGSTTSMLFIAQNKKTDVYIPGFFMIAT